MTARKPIAETGSSTAGRSRRRPIVVAAAVIGLLAIGGTTAALTVGGGTGKPSVTGILVDRRVPRLSLVDASGRTTSLAAFRGKTVVFAPFLTLCHEVCPLTTGAFEAMRHAVERAGLADRVVFAEVSVDPWRDTPARLRAFARMTGTHFSLFTGSKAQLERFWRFFGVAYYRTKEGNPPDTDWLTHKALTFDVGHTAGLFLLDASGRERILDVGMPNIRGGLSPKLKSLLNATGRHNLAHPDAGWTPQQGLDNLGYLLGRHIPIGT